MANLRKRVAACDLERRRPSVVPPPEQSSSAQDAGQDQLDNRPLIPKVSQYVSADFTR